MRIEATALQNDIDMITEDHTNPTHYTYDVFVKGGGAQVLALKMESYYIKRDYLKGYSDEAILVGWFVEQDVVDVMLPNAQDLDVIVSRRPLAPPEADYGWEGEGLVERYRGSMLDVTVPEVGEDNTVDRDKRNTMKRVSFQLIDRAIYELRLTSVGGTYRAATAADTLNTVLTATSTSLELDEAVRPLGVDFYPADTQLKADGTPNVRDHLIVPDGVKLADLAAYLHNNCGGIYNNGIGCYYQDRLWYVFPLYDNSRYNKASRTLNIVRVPAESLPDVPASYTKLGSHLFILGTGEALSIDTTNPQSLNAGSGTIFTTASGLFDRYAPSSTPDAVVDQSQVIGRISIDQRQDGMNATVYSKQRITDNVAKQISNLSAARQSVMQLGWGYSDPSLVYPGMPVRVMYNKAGIVETKQGTVVGMESFVEMAQPGMATKHYRCKSVLTLLVTDAPDNVV